jgi:hypothetical protein
MTPRSLFNIILKVLGIFFIKDFLVLIPQLLWGVYYLTQPGSRNEGIWTILTTFLILIVYWFIFYYLIFKTELIIDQLNLDKGFNQTEIPLNIHRSTILSISIIVIGGTLIVDAVPDFCRQLFLFFQEKRMTRGLTNPNISYTVTYGVKIVLGIALLIGQRSIVNFIEIRRKK